MPTLDRLTSPAPFSRLRAGLVRLWRALISQRPAVRAGLALTLIVGLVAAGYGAVALLVPSGTRYLASGRNFSSEELSKITQALDAKGISYRLDDRKVEVAAEQLDQAVQIYAKLHIGPLSFDEILAPPDWWSSLFETPHDKERKEQVIQERLIEQCINGLDGVVSSRVWIRYPRPTTSRRLRGKPSAFVRLETERNRPLPEPIVQNISSILINNEPDLSRETITVMGLDGHFYMDPLNPSVGDSSRDRAREEGLRDKILERLTHIKGVKVWVQLTDHRDGAGAAPAPAIDHATAAPPADPSPAFGVNRPIQVEEPPTTIAAARPATAAQAEGSEHGYILVNIPRSFYFTHMIPRATERDPTPEELQGMISRTKGQVEKLVKMVVPVSWRVDVDTIVDDVPLRPAALPAVSEARRKATDWGIVAVAIAAAIAFLTALASWIQAVRRPIRSPDGEGHSRRYRVDTGDEPNPSERVRELVRRDPEAAASVLQRWTTQGGSVS